MAKIPFGLVAAALCTLAALPAMGQETIKIGDIEPLSGPMASEGNRTARHFEFLIDRINAAGGAAGRKLELLLFDSKLNPQDSILGAQKAIDAGAHVIAAASGSSVSAALADFIVKNNARHPDKAALMFHHLTLDPDLTDQNCNYWQFRFGAHTDMLLTALAKYFRSQPQIKKIFLINQDYSYGRAISTGARKIFEQQGITIVGDELHPIGRVKDFSPYVAKIQSSGADAVVTGNWGNDMVLLIRAAIDSGLKPPWYTFYGYAPGTTTAIGKAGIGLMKLVIDWHPNMLPADMEKMAADFKAKTGDDFVYFRTAAMLDMLTEAIKQTGSDDPVKIAAALAGMHHKTFMGDWYMRPEDHQITYPIVIGTLQSQVAHDLENTGLGYVNDATIDRVDTLTPVKCTVKPPS